MVLVFNFGGQYAHLIARRIRELGVKSELVSPNISIKDIQKLRPQALIFSGSPYSVYEKNSPKVDPKIYDLNIPILGICYGMQLISYQLGGKVNSHQKKQFGKIQLEVGKSNLFKSLENKQIVWFSHGDAVEKLPKGFEVTAKTSSAPIAGFEDEKRKIYGIQFHPEVTHTKKGREILKNFLFKIAISKKDWDLKNVKANIAKKLKADLKEQKVLMALSGGVDSLVAAVFIREAVGRNLYCVFIDTGLLRNYDISDLKNVIKKVRFENVKIVNAKEKFLKALRGVVDPEEKRKKIAMLYFEILEGEAKKIGSILNLGQGTIYPDRDISFPDQDLKCCRFF